MTGCNKTKYRTEQFALIDIGRFKASKGDKYKPLRAYQCNKCGLWHLTSKPSDHQLLKILKEENKRLKLQESASSRKITELVKEIEILKSKLEEE